MEAREWDERYAARPELEWGAEPNRWVAVELADLPAGRALDLGTGEGRNAVWLAGRGWRVTAVDFSRAGLDKGRRLAEQAAGPDGAAGRPPISWVHADLRSYVPDAGSFELALAAYLHLPAVHRREVMRRAADALAPGGVLLVVGHDSSNLTEGVGGPQDADVLFTAQDVVDDLAGSLSSGRLRVQRAEAVLRPVPTPDGPRSAVDALVRIVRT